jgi:hypothetical protein
LKGRVRLLVDQVLLAPLLEMAQREIYRTQQNYGTGYRKHWEMLRLGLVCLKERTCWSFFEMDFLQEYGMQFEYLLQTL